MSEQLEKMEDAPIYIFRLESSERTVANFGAFTSYQVNVDANGNNIVGDAANEPSITVDPANRNRMAIGWRQFNSVGSNFRQAGWGYTADAGVTWSFPGVLQNIFRSDPVLESDDAGRFFYLSLTQDFFDDLWRSEDGGASWAFLAPATGGDKQWLTIDKTNSSGRGFQYQYWSTAGNNYGGRQFSRSTNGGVTWLNPIFIPNSPIWGTLDVNSAGILFLAGVNANTKQIWCVRSSNAKNPAVIPSFDQSTPVNLGGFVVGGDPINPEGIIGQLNVAVDRSGTSSNNNVYLLASVLPPGQSTGTEVMFVRSTNAGQSFSAPVRVNDDPVVPGRSHWFGAMSVAPNGRIDVVWLDTRYAANNVDSQLFYSYSTDAGVSWSSNVPVSVPFNPLIGYPNQNKIGDYMSIVSDDAGGNVAYCATFNGEQDVYYARVSPLTSELLNLSTRALVRTNDEVLIGGLVITGTTPKRILVRGIGPSLASAGLTGLLSNPTLTLFQGQTPVASNNDWKVRPDGSSQQAEIEATNNKPGDDRESAMVVTLPPGAYTAILSGQDGGSGIGLVEAYDLTSATGAELINISTRGFVGTEADVLIGGVVIGHGTGSGARVIVRAKGPSLAAAGVQGTLSDPTLTLYDAKGAVIAKNDNWRLNAATGQSQEAEVRATGLEPTDPRESTIVTSLAPGAYTAIVRGQNNSTGVALIEIDRLP
jgi:hypothetical protein